MPRRCASIATSLPSSPEPSRSRRVAPAERGVPNAFMRGPGGGAHSNRPPRRGGGGRHGIISPREGGTVRRIVAALMLFCLCAAARADDEFWYSVHLDGRKIGHMRSARAVEA